VVRSLNDFESHGALLLIRERVGSLLGRLVAISNNIAHQPNIDISIGFYAELTIIRTKTA
jgi:hypothetical protein